MNGFIHNIESFLTYTVEICTILLELFGIIVLVFTAIKSFVLWIQGDKHLRLKLAQGIALSLEFKMGSEVLRTVVVRDWSELGILGAVIFLRGLLTFLIHWEIKHEKEDLKKAKTFCFLPDYLHNFPYLLLCAFVGFFRLLLLSPYHSYLQMLPSILHLPPTTDQIQSAYRRLLQYSTFFPLHYSYQHSNPINQSQHPTGKYPVQNHWTCNRKYLCPNSKDLPFFFIFNSRRRH